MENPQQRNDINKLKKKLKLHYYITEIDIEKRPRLNLKECVNGIRKELSAEAELKRDEINAQNMKRRELLRKKKENWDQVTEELKQKVSAKTQLSRYRKRQSQ